MGAGDLSFVIRYASVSAMVRSISTPTHSRTSCSRARRIILTSSDGYASLTGELSTANGYTNGGYSVTPTWTRSGGKVTFDVSDPTWTASGGSITARWGAIIDTTAGRVVAYHLLESPAADVTTSAGNILTVKINAAGVFVIDD